MNEREPRVVPVFPLPETVFFPRTTLGLHIFEPRYRAMIRDVAAADGMFVVALRTGDGFEDLATVGRIRDLERLPDGRSNVRLAGLERVGLVEVPAETPYRQVRIEARPETVGASDAAEIEKASLDLLSSYGILRKMVRGDEAFVMHQGLPFEVAVNGTCAGLPVDAEARQRLLAAESLIDRQRLALEHLSSAIEILTWAQATRGGGAEDAWRS